MLLLVAVANAVGYWAGWGGEHPLTQHTVLDKILAVADAMFVTGRAFPLFMVVFGAGVAMLDASLLRRRGEGADQRPLIIRYRWLALIGALHMVFLNLGDVVMLYGLTGSVLVIPRVRRSLDRHRRTILACLVTLLVLDVAVMLVELLLNPGDVQGPPFSFDYPITQMLLGAGLALGTLVFFWLAVPLMLPLMMLGVAAVQSGMLADTPDADRVLRKVAMIGLPIAWLGGLPSGLEAAGLVALPGQGALSAHLSMLTGLIGGPAYGAAILLLCRKSQRALEVDGVAAVPAMTGWLAALGRRSLSGYLAQSLLFLPLATGYGLGLLRGVSYTVAVLMAVAVWLITLVGAVLLDRRGLRGPAEWALARLTRSRHG